MNEIDIIESGKIPTNLFGNLFIKYIILNYEYPRCFIANDISNNLYALLENKSEENNFGWNITKISFKDLSDVNKGIKNIQSLFLNKKSYLLNFSNNSKIGKIKPVIEFEGKYSIKGNMIVKNFLK